MDRRAVTVVKPHAMKDPCCLSHIAFHVFPEERTIIRTASITQLHVVTPGDQLPTQVDIGTWVNTHTLSLNQMPIYRYNARKVYWHQIKHTGELCEWIVSARDKLDQQVIDTEVKQWRTRLYAHIQAKGGHFEHSLLNWLHGSVVECLSQAGKLSLSCTRPVADGLLTIYVGKSSTIIQPTRPTQSFIPSGSIDE